MQRKIVNKLDRSLQQAEREREEHEGRYYQTSGSNRPRRSSVPTEDDYEYRPQQPPIRGETRQPYFPEPPPQAPMRMPSPARIAASFRESSQTDIPDRDDDEDNLSLTEERDYPAPAPARSSSSYDRDDYPPRSSSRRSSSSGSSRSKPRKSSKEREKPYESTKRPSRTRSITFKDSDDFTSSGNGSYGSSSSISSRGSGRRSRSHRNSTFGGHRKSSKSPSSSSHRRRMSPSPINSSAFASLSREVMALPIEIPESVTDEDAFRRYLSRSESSMESLGYSGSAAPLAKNLTLLAGQSIQKRTMALSQAIMTLALLSASASQLRFVVAYAAAQTYPALNYFLICSCIAIEIIVGIGYVILSRFDFSEPFVEKVHSYLIFGLFFVAVANVMIAAFALDDHVCGEGGKRKEAFDTIDQGAPPAAPPRNPP